MNSSDICYYKNWQGLFIWKRRRGPGSLRENELMASNDLTCMLGYLVEHEDQEECSLTPLEVIEKEIQKYDIGFNKYKQSYL